MSDGPFTETGAVSCVSSAQTGDCPWGPFVMAPEAGRQGSVFVFTSVFGISTLFAPLSSPPESRTETRLCSAFLDPGKSACSATHSSQSGSGHWGGAPHDTQTHTHTHTHACKHIHTLPPTSSCTSMYKTHSRAINTHSDTYTHTRATKPLTQMLQPGPRGRHHCNPQNTIHRTTPSHICHLIH